MDDMQGYDGWTDDPTTPDDDLGDGNLGDADADLDGLDISDPLAPLDFGTGVTGEGALEPTDDALAVGSVEGLPAQISVEEPRFGAALSPAGKTADSYGEDYYWSTTENSYLGSQTQRPIDEWTKTEAT